MNKKNVRCFMVLNIAVSMLLSGSAMAGISSSRSSGAKSTGGTSNSTSVKPNTTQADSVNTHDPATVMDCKQDPDAAKYFPLDFFKHITSDGSSISFEQKQNNKIAVKIPASLDACGKFVPQLIQGKENIENVVIVMTLDNGFTYGQYIKCLSGENKDKKVYLENGKIDHDKLKGSDYSEYSYALDYTFDKDKDIKKTLKLSYGYPTAYKGTDGYGSTFGIDSSVDMQALSSMCMVAEKVAPELTYLNEGRDVLLQKLSDTCKNGTAQQIADARRSIGNADALKDIADKLRAELDAGYLVKVQKDVERISSDMDKLENQINKEKDSMDEKTAKTVARKYADLTRELDNAYLNPAIKHLDDLMAQRSTMDEGDTRDKVDEQIKDLNTNIGKFSNRNQTSFANLYGVMEKYALTDSAKNIEDIRLKSHLYSRVFFGSKTDKRGEPLTLERANQKQVSLMQNFDKTMGDWTDQYLVGQGNLYPIKKTEKERQAIVNRMNSRWQTYQQTEQENYNKYCTGFFGASNPVRCREFMTGAEQRRAQEVKKWQKDNQVVLTRNAKLDRMGTNYNAYLKTAAEQRAAQSEMYNPYGSSYTSFEDNFADQYPGYQAPTAASSGYDAWRYSMGGQQPGMMMQQQQQYPMMQNAQMPMQGQYQMQQPGMMGGGWASM